MGLTLANVTEVQANLLKSTITLAKKSLIRKQEWEKAYVH